MGKTVLEELVVRLEVENKSLVTQLKKSQKITAAAAKKMAKSVDDFAKKSNKSMFSFKRVFETAIGFVGGQAVTAAFGSAKRAASALFRILVTDGIAAAQVQEDAINQLNTALALSGKFTKEASQDFQNFSSELQKNSKFGDEVILSTGALIQSLGQLDQQGLKKATQAAVDLSAALGIDLKAAALLVGKAATGEISSFSRYGLIIKKGADESETFANALDSINAKFGGAAAAQVKTFSGGVTQLGNSFGDTTEEIGFTITQNLAVISVIKELNKIVNEATSSISGQNGTLKELIAEGLISTIKATNILVISLDAIARAGESAFAILTAQIKVVSGSLAALPLIMQGKFKEALSIISQASKEAADDIIKPLTEDTGLGKVSELLFQLENAAKKGFKAMKDGAESTIDPINTVKSSLVELTEAQKKQAEDGQELAEQLIEQQEENDEIRLALLQERMDGELEILQEARNQQKITEEEHLLAVKTLNANFRKEETKQEDKQQKADEQRNKRRAQNFRSTLGVISTLSRSGNKELFEIGKAAAIAQAIIDGNAAVQKALAAAPPPFNFALAGLVGVATAVQVSNISAQGLRSGIDAVPGIGFADSFPAVLAPGERVVPQETNKDLSGFLKDQDGSRSTDTRSFNIEISLNENIMDFIEAKLIERDSLQTSFRAS